MFKKIILAADGSDHSLRAADKAVSLAKINSSSKVTVLYVIDEATSKADVLNYFEADIISSKRKEKLQKIEELLTKENIHHTFHFIQGEPGSAIVKYANEQEVDLVVIGSRGLNTLQEMVLGSVSHKVAKRVQAPVLIVK